jgi:hypothetical protein
LVAQFADEQGKPMTDVTASLVRVLTLFAEHVRAGKLARADLPDPRKLRAIPEWAAAWQRLPLTSQSSLNAWWTMPSRHGLPPA